MYQQNEDFSGLGAEITHGPPEPVPAVPPIQKSTGPPSAMGP
jgi:hypothetical protein